MARYYVFALFRVAILFVTGSCWHPAGHLAFAGVNQWTAKLIERGDTALLTMDPLDPKTLYASGAHGGFKTTDGGVSWTPIGYSSFSSPTALVIDPQDPQVVYQTFATRCDSIFKSVDGGKDLGFPPLRISTDPLSQCPIGSITSLIIDPSNSQILYAASYTESGIFKTTDGGAHWTQMFSGGTGLPIFLALDPTNPQVLYAGTYSSSDTPGGLFKTTNGGQSWLPISEGLTLGRGIAPLVFSPYAFVIDRVNSQILYVATYGGVFKSTNGGMNWIHLNSGSSPIFASALAIDPTNTQVLYAAADGGVLKSVDGGGNWKTVEDGLPRSPWALVVDFQNSQTLYAATYGEGGVYKSTDGGSTWKAANAGLTDVQVNDIAIDPRNSQTLYVALAVAGLQKSRSGGDKFVAIDSVESRLYNPPFSIAIDPTNPDTLYANLDLRREAVQGNSPSSGVFKTIDAGIHWTAINNGLPDDPNTSIVGDRADIVARVVIDPKNSQTLYVADLVGGIFKSNNGGAHWEQINAELKQVVFLTIDPSNPQILYAGTNVPSLVYKSLNGGRDWTSVSQGLPRGLIRTIVVDPNNPETLYTGFGGLLTEDDTNTGGLFKSTDGGINWERRQNGIPSQLGIFPIVIDPRNPQVLYAGTGQQLSVDPGGVYKSTDGGINWTPLNNGFPHLEGIGLGIISLALDPQDSQTLYAGTMKYGLFVLTQQ